MDEKPQRERFLNQNMIIAIIGAVSTILAATIPFLVNQNKNELTPTVTQVAPTDRPTFTALPPTEAFTFTPEPVEATATPTAVPVTGTPVMGFYDVYLALDPGGEIRSTTFPTDQPVYVFFSLNDPSEQRKVKFIWRTVEVAGYQPDSEVYRFEGELTKSKGSTQAGGISPWKPGKYKVELYLNGLLSWTEEFEIK
ncbi:MAG: hypothetical protein AB1649_01630 [Chloroflexota bacterium]